MTLLSAIIVYKAALSSKMAYITPVSAGVACRSVVSQLCRSFIFAALHALWLPQVLGLLNITPAKYEAMKASGNKSNADDEKNLCVICCDSPKSTVFVDCGHLATCLACAQNPALKACPICRVPKNKFIRVYT